MSNTIYQVKLDLELALATAKEQKDGKAQEFIEMALDTLEFFGYSKCCDCNRMTEDRDIENDCGDRICPSCAQSRERAGARRRSDEQDFKHDRY